jgi:preprotein translocase subunit SecF
LKDLSLALFIGLATGTYSSIFIATPILAVLREREPAMKALAKRVGSRSAVATATTAVVNSDTNRGPRNQPKRKNKR